MKAYPENINTPKCQSRINYCARMTVENTLGRWRGRLRRFSKRVDIAVESVTYLALPTLLQLHVLLTTSVNSGGMIFFLKSGWKCATTLTSLKTSHYLIKIWRQCESDATVVQDTLPQYFRTMEGKNVGQGIVD